MPRVEVAALVVVIAAAVTSRAVLFETTGDPNYNRTAPGGALTNSGWQYQGTWVNWLGTPIAPRYFIVAKHTGGAPGSIFIFSNFTYHVTWVTNCPWTDLQVLRVAETFPTYAPLYTKTNEVGRPCVVFGRGTQRGAPVIVGGVTNGWLWGTGDGARRWGENVVAGAVTIGELPGEYLRMEFNRGAGSNECHLSNGDSSGGLFIADDGVWKLAGIHSTVDGYFSTTGHSSNQFLAALLDMGGLYIGSGTNWTYIPDEQSDIPSSFYSVRISSYANWIFSVIDFLPGDDLRLSKVEVVGDDVLLHFPAASNRLYRVEYCEELTSGTWQVLTNGITGWGVPIIITNTGAAHLPQRFYRLALTQ